jgi:hypothetical protein
MIVLKQRYASHELYFICVEITDKEREKENMFDSIKFHKPASNAVLSKSETKYRISFWFPLKLNTAYLQEYITVHIYRILCLNLITSVHYRT